MEQLLPLPLFFVAALISRQLQTNHHFLRSQKLKLLP